MFIALVAAFALGLGVLGLRCGGPAENPTVVRIRGDIEAGRDERRRQQADELAAVARDLRLMAQRYLKQGEKQKAQRAIGAAQELDKKIQALTLNPSRR